jgi:flagellar basal body P-ring formation protein FlgA
MTQRKEKMLMPARPTMRAIILAVGMAAVVISPPAVGADEVENGEQIRAAVAAAVEPRLANFKDARVEIAVGAIDPRLRLPACAAPEVSLPALNAAIMTAKVNCPAPSWTIYVPVRLHAWIDAVVAAVNLSPDTKLDGSYLTRGRVDMFANHGALVTDMKQAEGKVLRVGLLVGSPVLSPFLESPLVVRRGQKVLLTLTASTMTIKTPALALEDGRIGDSIEVENPESQKTLRATVLSDGDVEVRF